MHAAQHTSPAHSGLEIYGCDTIWQAAERGYYTSLLGELFFEDSRRQYALSIRRYSTSRIHVIGHVRIA